MDRVGNTEGVVSGEREVVSEMDIEDTISRIRRLISSDSRARASDEEDREALAENEDQVRPW